MKEIDVYQKAIRDWVAASMSLPCFIDSIREETREEERQVSLVNKKKMKIDRIIKNKLKKERSDIESARLFNKNRARLNK